LKTELPEKKERLGWWMAAIFLVALGLRLLYLWQIQRAPFFALLMGDARAYHDWGVDIASGNFLGKGVFYQAPLYPYFLGLFLGISKGNLLVVRIVQVVIGACSCVLLAQAGTQFFSKRAGILAGFLLAFYAPAVFFDALIQKSVLDLFFLCLMLSLLGRIVSAPRRSLWVWLGVSLGCLLLTRENASVFIPAILIWLLVQYRNQRKAAALYASFFLIGLSVVLLPVALRNQWVGGEFHLTTSQFGPNFYIGNNPTANGTYQPLRPGRGEARFERTDATELAEQALGRKLTPGEVSHYWTQRALEYIRSQPADWLRLVTRKFVLLCNGTESSDSEDQYTYADWSSLLRFAGYLCHWGVILPLAFLGAWILRKERERLWLLYLLLGMYGAGMLMFYVFARYRHPMSPFLVLFAAAGLARVRHFFNNNPAKVIGVCGASTLAVALFCNWPIVSKGNSRAAMLVNMSGTFFEKGDFTNAIQCAEEALKIAPGTSVALHNLGAAYAGLGRLEEAAKAYRQALEMEPDSVESHSGLGVVLLFVGQPDDAEAHFREALRLNPNFAGAHYWLGEVLHRKQKHAEALQEWRQALALEPSPNVLNNVAWLLATSRDDQVRDGKEAVVLAEQACALVSGAELPSFLYTKAAAYAEAGRFADAIQVLQELIEAEEKSANKKEAELTLLRSRLQLYQSGQPYRE
jgi:tetratricopeptide (TPR) repeat protein